MLFHVLGPLEVHARNGRIIEITAEKRRRLLAALLLRFNSWAAVDLLIEAVWPGRPPASAPGNLKTYVHHLRQVLPPRTDGQPRIESRPGYYRLQADRSECDATTFADLVGRGRTAVQSAVPAAAVTHFQEALDLWRGQPFETLDSDQTRAEAALLKELRWSARDDLADALLAAGRPAAAISLLTPLTTEDPLREPTWQRLLTAYHRADRRADGLAAYRQARNHLVDELGVEPGAELQRLHLVLLEDPVPEPEDQSAAASADDIVDVLTTGLPPVSTPPSPASAPPSPVSAPPSLVSAPPSLVSAPPGAVRVAVGTSSVATACEPTAGTTPPEADAPPDGPPPGWDELTSGETEPPRRRIPHHFAVSAATAVLLLIGALLFTLSDPPWDFGSDGGSAAAPDPSETPVNQVRPGKSDTPGPKASATSGPKKAGSEAGGGEENPEPPPARGTGTPRLSFVSPSDGKMVSGTVTIRVKVSNPSRLSQVDFHYLTMMCEPGGYKKYIGNDKTPDSNGVYEIRFDTSAADDGCLDFGAVGIDHSGDTLYPPDGVYVNVTVNN